MAKIKSGNTKPEIKLRKALHQKGIRFRINNKVLFGNPDISIKKYRLVIFVDGEFWHGFNWVAKKPKIQANRSYWIPKIERNIERDRLVNQHYKATNWVIFRFWEKEINSNLDACVNTITNYIIESNQNIILDI
jgi:DNA mismatch endonuclease (patch repair protein)